MAWVCSLVTLVVLLNRTRLFSLIELAAVRLGVRQYTLMTLWEVIIQDANSKHCKDPYFLFQLDVQPVYLRRR